MVQISVNIFFIFPPTFPSCVGTLWSASYLRTRVPLCSLFFVTAAVGGFWNELSVYKLLGKKEVKSIKNAMAEVVQSRKFFHKIRVYSEHVHRKYSNINPHLCWFNLNSFCVFLSGSLYEKTRTSTWAISCAGKRFFSLKFDGICFYLAQRGGPRSLMTPLLPLRPPSPLHTLHSDVFEHDQSTHLAASCPRFP